MDDAEFEAQKARIETAFHRWQNPLGLGYWLVHLIWEREGRDFESHTDGQTRSTCAARCFADWRYNEATITFNVPLYSDMDDDTVERTVVHELMHIFLNEVREEGLPHEERVASHLTSAFRWVRDSVAKGEDPAIGVVHTGAEGC
ncbi:MAG: hypothetical protein U0990_05495 [Candidatus Nanopelagicales bacterium]|nr:hypothetical protein [Candidatus Nanopelagicales bacterium]